MPANGTIFEIHACAKGRWRTLGTFDDANRAIAEAVRLRRTLKYSGIRVTAENYQNNSGEFASRVVYRYSHETRAPGSCPKWPGGAFATSDPTEPESPDEVPSVAPMIDHAFVRMLFLRLGFVVLAAVITLWALHSN
jgi:hypothetical protein